MSRSYWRKEDIINDYLIEEKSSIILKLKDTDESKHLPFECKYIHYDWKTKDFEYQIQGHDIAWTNISNIEWIEDIESCNTSTEK